MAATAAAVVVAAAPNLMVATAAAVAANVSGVLSAPNLEPVLLSPTVRKRMNFYFLLSNQSIEGFSAWFLNWTISSRFQNIHFCRLLESDKLPIIHLIRRYMTTVVCLIMVWWLHSSLSYSVLDPYRTDWSKFLEPSEIPELYGVFVIYIAEVRFVFERRSDRVKAERFRIV